MGWRYVLGHSDDMLALIRSGNPLETQVPPLVAEVIKNRRLFGYRG